MSRIASLPKGKWLLAWGLLAIYEAGLFLATYLSLFKSPITLPLLYGAFFLTAVAICRALSPRRFVVYVIPLILGLAAVSLLVSLLASILSKAIKPGDSLQIFFFLLGIFVGLPQALAVIAARPIQAWLFATNRRSEEG